MPEIGRPQQSNPFAGISKTPAGQTVNTKKKTNQNVGDSLNQIAGIEEEKQFVDRKTHNQMGKDGFLKLLSFQLQNQDPIKPMDQKEFASDLAQFSQLEQLTNMNTKFDKFGANQPQEMKYMGATFLGKEVLTKGSSVNYNGSDRNVDIPFYLDNQARNVTVNIYDSKRQLVAKVEAEDLPKGQNHLTWNGKQLDGIRAVKDDYTIEVVAYDNQMNKFKAQTHATGLVSGVRFENGETILTLQNGKEIFLRDVDSFKVPSNEGKSERQQLMNQKQAAQSYQNTESQLP